MPFNIIAAADSKARVSVQRSGWSAPPQTSGRVSEIIAGVRARGDAALLDYTREFDAPEFTARMLRVPVLAREQFEDSVPGAVLRALEVAKERVSRFHERQLPQDLDYTDGEGATYGFHFRPLRSIAAYVPAGNAPLASSVLMNVVPAKVAGVQRVVVFSPPQSDGCISPAIRYACALCGVDEIYAVGGAQAIAAAAYGTPSVSPVDKIVGPGNVWVTEAKRQVFGVCAIDGLAGPSEVLIVADAGADVERVVWELLAQAEHDPMAQVAVVSESHEFLAACARFLEAFDPSSLGRGDIVAGVLSRGLLLIEASNRSELLDVVETFAPEHLSLQVEHPELYLPFISRAGAIFIGPHTPVACGDYLAGTNHVLPTSGSARFASGLRTLDFMRSFSLVTNTESRMRDDAGALAALADYEGLGAHARTARMRTR